MILQCSIPNEIFGYHRCLLLIFTEYKCKYQHLLCFLSPQDTSSMIFICKDLTALTAIVITIGLHIQLGCNGCQCSAELMSLLD